jgi:predicted metal-binding membrane protein
MTTTTHPSPTVQRLRRLRHDPAIGLWGIAGACWTASLAVVLMGDADLADHDHVIEHSTLPWPLRIAAFMAVWVVMLGAMMMPTLVPLARRFTVVSGNAPHPRAARAGLYAGYLAVWIAFAPLALLGDTRIHWLVDTWPWLAAHEGLILSGALLLAGAFQFSRLKNACLTVCRNPAGFLWQHYRRGTGNAVRLGARHGLLCVGCCWALMLLMFATGVGSLLWMLGLTAVMVAEKTTRIGARLVKPVGAALVAGGLVIAGLALLAS